MMTNLEIHAQQDLNDRWMFWIVAAGNQAALVKSCRKYTTRAAAIKGARKVIGGQEVFVR